MNPQQNECCYDEAYKKSLECPEEFWSEIGGYLDWHKPWDKILDNSNEPFTKWYFKENYYVVFHPKVTRYFYSIEKKVQRLFLLFHVFDVTVIKAFFILFLYKAYFRNIYDTFDLIIFFYREII